MYKTEKNMNINLPLSQEKIWGKLFIIASNQIAICVNKKLLTGTI